MTTTETIEGIDDAIGIERTEIETVLKARVGRGHQFMKRKRSLKPEGAQQETLVVVL
jgi:hypothetical protein